jgi:long-chain acyl-CoA synthetase
MFASAAQAFELTPHDILLPGSSCWHIGGFGFSFSALAFGARVVAARGFDHDEIGPLLRTTPAHLAVDAPHRAAPSHSRA